MTRTGGRSLNVALLVTCWLVFAVHWAPYLVREHFPAITLAESGTLDVSPFLGWSEDVFPGPHGGAFINNNPGVSIAAGAVLVVLRPALDAVERWNLTQEARRLDPALESRVFARAAAERREWFFLAVCFATAALVMAPVSAFAVAVFERALRRAGVDAVRSLGAALLLAFGTPVFLRTAYLNQNLLVGYLAMAGFLVLATPSRDRVRPVDGLLAGACSGVALLLDYAGAVVGVTLFVHLAWRLRDDDVSPWTSLVAYALGAFPGAAALAAYQWWAFGNPLAPAQHFMPAVAQTVAGYRGISYPSPRLAFELFFDPRFGLFVYSPVLALALLSPFAPAGTHRLPHREAVVCWLFAGLLLLLCASNRYTELQWTTGVRYMVPAVPPLLVLALQGMQVLPASLPRILAALSVAMGWAVAVGHERAPFAFAGIILHGLQLSWLRRMSYLGLVAHPAIWSWLLVAASGVLVAWTWRRERGRAYGVPVR